jgi:hypothetical protein
VLFDGQEVGIIERTEPIEVAGRDPVDVTLRWVPDRGPVIAGRPIDGAVVTQRWTRHDAPLDLEAYPDLMRAGSVAGAMDVLAGARPPGAT